MILSLTYKLSEYSLLENCREFFPLSLPLSHPHTVTVSHTVFLSVPKQIKRYQKMLSEQRPDSGAKHCHVLYLSVPIFSAFEGQRPRN